MSNLAKDLDRVNQSLIIAELLFRDLSSYNTEVSSPDGEPVERLAQEIIVELTELKIALLQEQMKESYGK